MCAVYRGRYAGGTRNRGGDRPRPAGLLSSLLLSLAVFALAVLAGVLLTGAAPAGPVSPPGTERASSTGDADRRTGPDRPPAAATAYPRAGNPAADPVFAQSMVYSGSLALVLSIVGMVMVGRRRRFW